MADLIEPVSERQCVISITSIPLITGGGLGEYQGEIFNGEGTSLFVIVLVH